MINKILLSVLFVFCLGGELFAAGVPLPDLSHIEKSVNDGPEVLAALSELARDGNLLVYQKERATPMLYAGLSVGYNNEPIARTLPDREKYTNAKIVAGVSFPLLGTWSQQKIAVLRAELQSVQSRYASGLAKSRNLEAVRKAYAVIWAQQKKEPVLKAFLANEPAADALFIKRRNEGYLLETDRLEFMSAFENCRRELAMLDYRKKQALNVISLAAGKEYLESPIPETPSLPKIDTSALDEKRVAEENPEYLMKHESVKIYEKILQQSNRPSREATFDVGAFYTDDFPGTPGTGAYVAFTIKEPFGSVKSDVRAAKQAVADDLSRAAHEKDAARMRIEAALKENIALQKYCTEAISFAAKRLHASCESIRIRELRHKTFSGDTFESLQQSRYDYLRTASDMIDAKLYLLQTHIELISMLSGNESTERTYPLDNAEKFKILFDSVWLDFGKDKPVLPEKFTGGVQYAENTAENSSGGGVYVWDAEPFLDRTKAAGNLGDVKKSGFRRILISFNSRQIKTLHTDDGRDRLLSLLNMAQGMGVAVELLLGDPTWALPEGRDSLLTLLRFFEPFPFSAVHLDIEPDSLPDAEIKRPHLLRELFATLKMAKNAVARPIFISMHPRYFEEELGRITASLLKDVPVAEISLMIYSTNMRSVRARFQSIVARFPAQNFVLAQSVESVLPPEESWFKAGREKFHRGVTDIYPGVLVQAWEDYKKMRP